MTDLLDLAFTLETQAQTSRWMPRGFRSCCKAIRQAIQSGDLVSAHHWLNSVWCPDTKHLLRPVRETLQDRITEREHRIFSALVHEPGLPSRPGKLAHQILEAKIRKLQSQY